MLFLVEDSVARARLAVVSCADKVAFCRFPREKAKKQRSKDPKRESGSQQCVSSDVVGDGIVVGDTRWAGSWGIAADFSARTACSIMCIRTSDIMVGWFLCTRRGVCVKQGSGSTWAVFADILLLYFLGYLSQI